MNPLHEYLLLLSKLHQLEIDGKFESDEADDVRDKMDVHWYRLTDDQLALVRLVSAALNKELQEKEDLT